MKINPRPYSKLVPHVSISRPLFKPVKIYQGIIKQTISSLIREIEIESLNIMAIM